VIDTLERTVTKPALDVCAALQDAGYEAYVVGGCVRDALLGRDVNDWDVTTDALPEQVQKVFRRTIPTGIQHGTVTVLIGREHIEVTTFRGEGAYTDARRPDSVTFGVPLREDLARRDFVINAMAYDPRRKRLVDPFGGQADLEAGVLRAVGEASERFTEDGLRIMRAVRFVATLELVLDADTEAAIPAALPSLAKVSAERVRDELLGLLGAREPTRGLVVAERTGVLDLVLPERTAPLAVVDAMRPDPIARLAALVSGLDRAGAAAVGRRLKLSNLERERVAHLVGEHRVDYAATWTDADVRRWVAAAKREHVADILDVRAAVAEEVAELRARAAAVIDRKDPLYANELAVTGQDVIATLGIAPGPEVGRILGELLEVVLEEPAANTRDGLLGRLSGET
jgi:tRNA nucleotidyltransferase (CCA-adding enzyme)